jgi:imidazoleglycerol-phosphate dehydratase
MIKRSAARSRKTNETTIELQLNLEGKGESQIDTGIGFFDHMLQTFAKHGSFDLTVAAEGDLCVDQHHLVEDVGIALGEAFLQALGDKTGINRAGCFAFPMDESLGLCAVDLSGRPFLEYRIKLAHKKIGAFETVNLPNFFAGFVNGAKLNLHILLAYGKDPHHKVEACFKAFGKAMRIACSLDKNVQGIVPSTKGVL